MELDKALFELINTISEKGKIRTIQIGTAVNVTATKCDVKRDDQPDLLDVRLNAIDDDLQTYSTIVPVEGSAVLVAIIENQVTHAVIVSCSEVEKIIWKCEDTTMEFMSGSVKFQCGDETALEFATSGLTANGGTLGGIPKLTETMQNFNIIKNYVALMKDAVLAALGTIDAAVPCATSATFTATMATLGMTLQNIENVKFKQ